ncbi:MAG: CAP domain-containing protein [candidate division WOR-3 bacterium]
MLALALLLAADPAEWFKPEDAERLFYRETNMVRTEEGLDTLAYDSLLSKAARAHSEEMAKLDYLSHTSPVKENRTVKMRVAKAGVDTVNHWIGENICLLCGYGKPYMLDDLSDPFMRFGYLSMAKDAIEVLMGSPGHRANILSENYTRLGVGVAVRWEKDKERLWIYFTQVFWGE